MVSAGETGSWRLTAVRHDYLGSSCMQNHCFRRWDMNCIDGETWYVVGWCTPVRHGETFGLHGFHILSHQQMVFTYTYKFNGETQVSWHTYRSHGLSHRPYLRTFIQLSHVSPVIHHGLCHFLYFTVSPACLTGRNQWFLDKKFHGETWKPMWIGGEAGVPMAHYLSFTVILYHSLSFSIIPRHSL
jgi:hypothetical protein